jgi:copper chaperone
MNTQDVPQCLRAKTIVNPAATIDVDTPGEYTSREERFMESTTRTNTTTTLAIDGMTCGHCVQAATKALGTVPGVVVESVAVGGAEITAPDGLTVARAINALGEAGYAARASEVSAGAAAGRAPGASCCGGGNRDAARRSCCG